MADETTKIMKRDRRRAAAKRSRSNSSAYNAPVGEHAINAAVGIAPGHVAGVRARLIQAGFNVNRHGALTPRLLKAWKEYRSQIHQGRNDHQIRTIAHAWNRSNPPTQDKTAAATQAWADRLGHAHVKAKNPASPQGNTKLDAAHGHTKAKGKAAANAKHLGAGTHKVGGSGMPGVVGGGPSVNKLISTSMAEKLAGLQFDPQIRQAALEQARQKRDQAQAERDINSWAGQVQGSQATARQRDQAAGAGAAGDVKNVIAGLIDSLGGSRGAGVIGATGVNDLTSVDKQAAAENTFNADLAPILKGEQATNLSRQRALGSQEQEKLASALIDLQGQRGQAKAKALMDIIQANNAARQSNFGNRLAIQNAALAAESMGMKESEFAAQLKQMGLSNAIAKAKLHAQQQATKAASGHPNWALLNPIERRQLADQAVSDAVGTLPSGVWDETHILNQAYHNLRSGGYLSARRAGFKGRIPSRVNQTSIIGAIQSALGRARQQHAGGGAAAA